MSLTDLFSIFSRLASSPDRLDGEDARILKFARKYFDAMYAIERKTLGSLFESRRQEHDQILVEKSRVHQAHWCNPSPF